MNHKTNRARGLRLELVPTCLGGPGEDELTSAGLDGQGERVAGDRRRVAGGAACPAP